MKITVRYFAIIRERTGLNQQVVDLPPEGDIDDLFAVIVGLHPSVAELKPILRFAVNQQFVTAGTVLNENDEVVLIPPVSGGDGRILLTTAPLDVMTLRDTISSPKFGAIVIFEGVVRDHRAGEQVETLEYETYEEMALRQLCKVATEVEDEFPVQVGIHHRHGLMKVGDTAVVIAVGSAHRGPAFDACRQVIERLKADVPIWKKETGPDGSVWVGVGP
jgi:molybdopterin synthase catalytic subunit